MDIYYDRQGNPTTQDEWAADFEFSNREVARTPVTMTSGVKVVVSTVWLGLDHQFGPGPPLIFETMIFGLSDDNEIGWRYTTEKEALAGHKRAVACLRDPLGRFNLSGV